MSVTIALWYALAVVIAGSMSAASAGFGIHLLQRDRSKLPRWDVLGLQSMAAVMWAVLLYAYGIDFGIVPIVQLHLWLLMVGVFVAQQCIYKLWRWWYG
jgi:hypothetical protein